MSQLLQTILPFLYCLSLNILNPNYFCTSQTIPDDTTDVLIFKFDPADTDGVTQMTLEPTLATVPPIVSKTIEVCFRGSFVLIQDENFGGNHYINGSLTWLFIVSPSDYQPHCAKLSTFPFQSWRSPGNSNYSLPSIQLFDDRYFLWSINPFLNQLDTTLPPSPSDPIILDPPNLFRSFFVTGRGLKYFLTNETTFVTAANIICIDTTGMSPVSLRFYIVDSWDYQPEWPRTIQAVTWMTSGFPSELSVSEQEKLVCVQPEQNPPTTTTTTEEPTTEEPTTTTTSTTTMATTTTTTTPSPFICTAKGRWPDPRDETKFHVCTGTENNWTDSEFDCMAGTVFCKQCEQCYYKSYCVYC